MTTNTTEDKIRAQIQANPVLLYMKGTPATPQCGFSGKAVAALNAVGADFAYVNVMENPFIREKLPKVSNWPTYPQLFIGGELVGGADIVEDMAKTGELKTALEKVLAPAQASA